MEPKSAENDKNASGRLRWKISLGILVIGILAIVIAWVLAGENRTYQIFSLWVILPTIVFLQLLWWLFLSGISWRARRIGFVFLLVLVGMFFGLFRFNGFTGDFIPQFALRFLPSAEERAEEYWGNVGDVSQAVVVDSTNEPLEILNSDWPGFRGVSRDGIVPLTAINRNWKTSPPALLWKHPIGKGWSSFAVVNRLAYTQEQRGEEEVVACYDIDTGEHLWTHADKTRFASGQGGPGPMATPTVYESHVYTVGGAGMLNCLDARTGNKVWSVNILKDADAQNIEWGMSGSPLVYDDLVVVNPGGGKGKGVAAYHRLTGEKSWATGNEPAGYASPSLAVIGGVRQLLIFHAEGLSAYDPRTGKELWKSPEWKNQPKVNSAQPIVRDEKLVYISSGYGLGNALFEVTENDGNWTVTEKWRDKRGLSMKFTAGVYHDGFVYGLDEQILSCVELKTGKRQWRKRGKFGYGQLILVDEYLLILTESGEMVLYEAKPKSPQELGRFQAIEGITWNHPVLHRGKLLVRNGEEAACYDLNPVSSVARTE